MKPILATEARLQYSSLPAELPHSPHFTEIYHLLKKEQQVLNKLLKFFDICFIEMYIIKNIPKVVSLAYNGHILTPCPPGPAHLAGWLPTMEVHSSLLADPEIEIPEPRPRLIQHLGILA